MFEFAPDTGEVLRVIDVYSGLEDPGRPIPPESTAIHGITDEMVAGKRIDDGRVAAVLAGVSIVIAHNASFDRPFLERRLPAFARLPWACSMSQIDWKAEGFGSVGLEFLAYRSGFFYDAHRSEMDCRALLEVINRPLPGSGNRPLGILQAPLSQTDWRVYAVGAAFETKDLLKARGYRWDAGQKLWHQTLPESEMPAEIEWLKAEVYKRPRVTLDFEGLDALVRFSGRPGKRGRKEV
jgi:DNA polymerase-3 subunit epsilon